MILARQPTFVNSLFVLSKWQQKLLTTFIAVLVLALSANIAIPTQPVPFSLQSMVVLIVGACLGRKLGGFALLQYLFLGALGLPIFANGVGGIAALISPSAGYLYGFVFSGYLAGFAAERGYDRNLFSGIISFALAHQIIFVFGVFYLSFYFKISLKEAFQIGYLPFVLFDFLKFIFAAMIMFALWRLRGRKV